MADYLLTKPDKTARTSGIAAQSVASASRFLGAEIDNLTNKDDLLDLEIEFSFAAAPAADKSCELWLLYDCGHGYEPGDASADAGAKARLVASWSPRTDRTADRFFVLDYDIGHYKFKLLVKNVDVGQNMTITVYALTGKAGLMSG